MHSEPNYYDVLEVAHSASTEVIQAAYRRLCQKYHPDHNRHDSDAHSKMVQLNAAYEVLNDPDQRQAYDALLAAGQTESGRSATHSDREGNNGWGHLVKKAVKAVVGGVVSLVQFVFGIAFWLFILGVVLGVLKEWKQDETGKPSAGTVAASEAKLIPPDKRAGGSSPQTSMPPSVPRDTMERDLRQMAEELNARAPYGVAEGVNVTKALAEKDRLIVTAMLLTHRRAEINVGAFELVASKSLAAVVCADQSMRQYLNLGATFVYTYFGNDDRLIAEIPISLADCHVERKADGGV
ncbi:MAG: J domain-containing protein [Nitrospira sp.]|nr:J domain-containing protein [Nitrospira sp.]